MKKDKIIKNKWWKVLLKKISIHIIKKRFYKRTKNDFLFWKKKIMEDPRKLFSLMRKFKINNIINNGVTIYIDEV